MHNHRIFMLTQILGIVEQSRAVILEKQGKIKGTFQVTIK